jgi:hypothetical protein
VYYGIKLLPDGREASVFALTFNRARLVVGKPGGMTYGNAW